VLETGRKAHAEIPVRVGGRTIIFDLVAEPLRDASGAVIGLTGASLDITERKLAEEALHELPGRLLAVQDEERRRVARELHDQTAQRLVALALELKTLETNLAAGRPQGERLRSLRDAVDNLQQQVRQIAWDLHAGELVAGDLESALREHVEEWSERARVPVEYECLGLGDERLPAQVEATLYRVAQEALTNVEKHAEARRVSVLLECDGALARLTVEDDGRGFDVDAVQESLEAAQRLGLLGMKERVALAGGTLLLESSPGAGTTILVRIPIPTAGKPQ
jgi:signal transduction histidine kinase